MEESMEKSMGNPWNSPGRPLPALSRNSFPISCPEFPFFHLNPFPFSGCSPHSPWNSHLRLPWIPRKSWNVPRALPFPSFSHFLGISAGRSLPESQIPALGALWDHPRFPGNVRGLGNLGIPSGIALEFWSGSAINEQLIIN